MSHSELAASYAALILADDEVEITVRKQCLLPMEHPLINAVGRQASNPHQGRQC